tara:strand:- start:514 stop:714 length:201 start_codon:yes stop_codon:yes gene_type:complete
LERLARLELANLLIRNQVLYPIELQTHINVYTVSMLVAYDHKLLFSFAMNDQLCDVLAMSAIRNIF